MSLGDSLIDHLIFLVRVSDFSEKNSETLRDVASWGFPPLCYRCGITLKTLESIAA